MSGDPLEYWEFCGKEILFKMAKKIKKDFEGSEKDAFDLIAGYFSDEF